MDLIVSYIYIYLVATFLLYLSIVFSLLLLGVDILLLARSTSSLSLVSLVLLLYVWLWEAAVNTTRIVSEWVISATATVRDNTTPRTQSSSYNIYIWWCIYDDSNNNSNVTIHNTLTIWNECMLVLLVWLDSDSSIYL